jgi:hypothetical protein
LRIASPKLLIRIGAVRLYLRSRLFGMADLSFEELLWVVARMAEFTLDGRRALVYRFSASFLLINLSNSVFLIY